MAVAAFASPLFELAWPSRLVVVVAVARVSSGVVPVASLPVDLVGSVSAVPFVFVADLLTTVIAVAVLKLLRGVGPVVTSATA